jgi:stage V sporulation protein G
VQQPQQVSEINIVPVKPQAGLVAFASFVLFEAVYCGSVAVFTRPNGSYRLSYPNRRVGGREIDVFYPISKQVGEAIEVAVINKYEEVMSQNDVRHDFTQHTI